MFRSASRSILRSAKGSLAPVRTATHQRFLSTAPPDQKSRGFKSTAARWGLAVGAIYYYNTSELFAEQPAEFHLDPKADYDDAESPTLDAITQSSRNHKRKQQPALASLVSEDSRTHGDASSLSLQPESESTSNPPASDPADLEEEASSEGAFNPETGEINWDCPCLGGMAHGPCGEEFRAAFSCFVFSEEEPKGMNCIDKFQGMQQCFRAHPDVYAAELEGDDNEELDEGLEQERKELVKEIQERREKAGTDAAEAVHGKRLLDADPPMERKPLLRRSQPEPSTTSSNTPPSGSEPPLSVSENHEADGGLQVKPILTKRQSEYNADKATKTEVSDENVELVPKAWHDSRSGLVSDQTTEK